MRYSIELVVLDKYHPYFPNQSVFKIYDSLKRQFSYGCYTTHAAAEEMLTRKRHRWLNL